MKRNRTKEKLTRGEPAFGYAIGLGSPVVTELLAGSGVDFLLIDNQHGTFGADSTILSLMAMASSDATPIVRVARNDYTLIGRLLDEGAMGVVVPMVHTASDARAAADACRLPPRGTRSGGWGRAARYGDDYPDWIDGEVLVIVQIESIQAVENAEAILSTPGVDGIWLGPGDLALSLGIDPRKAAEDDRHARAVERTLQACRDTGKFSGFATATPEDAKRLASQGWQYLTAGSDIGFIQSGALAGVKTLGLT